MKKIQSNITSYQEQQRLIKSQKDKEEQGVDLDRYMENLQAESPVDKTEIKKLRVGKTFCKKTIIYMLI